MSYTIDIHRNQLKPSNNIISFFAFVSFFPQLVAGPIERASNLLNQFNKPRKFSYEESATALRQILWGLFQKVVVADNCAVLVEAVFSDYSNQSGLTLMMGAIMFSLQIYGDFAGYSNIAIGLAKLLGFNLMQNFQSPYFSQNITELWRRWHISLSTWLRDYLYTPLAIALRNQGKFGIALSTTITFLLCGLWHGAAWNFVIFGTFHGAALTFEIFTKKQRKKIRKKLPDFIYGPVSNLLTFTFWTVSLIIFRIEGSFEAFAYIKQMFTVSFVSDIPFPMQDMKYTVYWILGLFVILDYIGRNDKFAIERISNKWPRIIRYIFYSILLFFIFLFFQTKGDPFIYFQF